MNIYNKYFKEGIVHFKVHFVLLLLSIVSMLFSIGVSTISLFLLYFIALLSFNKGAIKNIERIDLLFIIFFFVNLISLSWTKNLSVGLNNLEKTLSFVFVPFFFIGIRARKIKVNYDLIFRVFIWGGIILCGIIFFSSLRDVIINDKEPVELVTKNVRFNLVKISPISFHPPYMGLYINFILVLIYLNRNKLKKSFIIPSVLFLLFFLYLNSSMMSFLSLIICGFVILIINVKKKYLLYSLSFISMFFLLIYAFYSNEIKTFLIYDPADGYWETPRYRILRFFHEGDPTRKQTWNFSKQIIKSNFWFGVGIGDFVDVLQSFRDTDSFAFKSRLNSHNQYLSVLGKTGIIGTVIFLMLLIENITKAIKRNSLLYISFITLTYVTFFTENLLDRQWGFVFFTTFNYIIYEYTKNTQREIT